MPISRFIRNAGTSVDAIKFQQGFPVQSLFHSYLTDDGTDSTLNENYASATDAYVAFTSPSVITSCIIELLDSDIAQNDVLSHELWVGGAAALTNGLKFAIKNSAGTVIHDISVTIPIKALYQLDSISSFVDESGNTANATTGSNHHAYLAKLNFPNLYGKSLLVNNGDRFVCTLQDDFSGLAFFYMHLYGFRF